MMYGTDCERINTHIVIEILYVKMSRLCHEPTITTASTTQSPISNNYKQSLGSTRFHKINKSHGCQHVDDDERKGVASSHSSHLGIS
jgi:hypothetical protein